MPSKLRLEVGDCLPDFRLMDQQRRLMGLFSLARGKPLVVLCFDGDRWDEAQEVLQGLTQAGARLGDLAHVFAVSDRNIEETIRRAEALALPFPLLADPERQLLAAFDGQDGPAAGLLAWVIADANRRILTLGRDPRGADLAAEARGFLAALPQEAPREIGHLAPVLVVPEVFDEGLCQTLMARYESGGNAPTGVTRGDRGVKAGEYDRDMKLRRDHYLDDPVLQEELTGRLAKRVIPEMRKVFDFKATRAERLRIGCYEASERGFFEAHRDNVDPAGGRRFAMSLNLNTGAYEGGYLRFPEYGPHLYRPESGAALIFSTLLVHEATPVTAGRRFVLLTFFRS